jgi:alanyl aminopeptidase
MHIRFPHRAYPVGFCSLLFVLLSAAPLHAADDLRLGDQVAPIFEAITLVVDANQKNYSGSVHLDLQVRERTSHFRFHAEEMKLDEIVLRPAGKKEGAEIDLVTKEGKIGLVEVTTKTALEPGGYSLDIDFSNEFGTRAVGLYRMDQDGQGYVSTQFEATEAREAFPCWDEPAVKIPYQVTLVVPADHMAISNTPIEKESTKANAKTVVFRKTKPMPSYLLAMVTGPFEAVEIPGMSIPGRIITPRGQSHLAGTAVKFAPPILAALERWFDRKYPYEKLDFIAIPEYAHGAMENPGAITFLASLLLHDPKTMSTSSQSSLAKVMAHEIAHQWFGNLVTMEWWDDLWLNESFADWMGDKISDQVHPEYKIALAEQQSVQEIMSRDAWPSSEAIHQHFEADDDPFENLGIQYNKGKAVLAMFERWVGPENFRKGVLDYIESNAWGNATSADLWKALSKTSDQDVSGAMATFLDPPGVPFVTAEVQLDGKAKLTQTRFLNFGVEAPAMLWQVPVALKYSDGKTTRTKTVLLKEASQTLSLESDGPIDWVIPDVDAAGYYRWSVPPAMLVQLSTAGAKSMNPAERIGFIGNLGALLDRGTIRGDDYLRAVAHFGSESDPMVLLSLTESLDKMRKSFVPDELSDAFAVYVQRTLQPALERIGNEKKPGESEEMSLLRPKLMEWLGKYGKDQAVLTHASQLAQKYLVNPAEVDPALSGTALRLSAIHGDQALWNEYRQRFETAGTPAERSRYLQSLGEFTDPALVEKNLRYALEGPLRAQEVMQVTRPMDETAQGRDRLYRWLTENYDAIVARIPPPRVGFLPRMAGGCEAERMEAARAFFSDPKHISPGTTETLAKTSDQVKDCVDLRKREGAAVTAYLNELAQ